LVLDPYEELASFVSGEVSDDEIIKKIEELDIRSDKAAVILAQTLFDSSILSSIQKHVKLLAHVLKTEKDQKAFLGGLERLIGMTHRDLLPKAPLIFKAFYDADLVDEEVILAWGEKSSKKYVDRKISKEILEKAEPFLKWLREAEEESSEDEE
jgi:translation initiation factor 5